MKPIQKNSIFISLAIAVIVMLCLCSCASRKVNKSDTKETEKTEVKSTEQTNTNVTDNTKIIDTSVSDEIEIIPVDNSKPIIVNGQKLFNAKIKQRKVKSNISVAKDIKVSKNEQKEANLSNHKTKVVQQKHIDKKSSYFWMLWLLLVIFLLYCFYLYKKKILHF